ncbi:MAG TPA: MFS transporter [Pyrinomonadaceae bacterium]|jgi:MFS family permease|nr:MFS transporter [Pyrinomonadaceae bacterium]
MTEEIALEKVKLQAAAAQELRYAWYVAVVLMLCNTLSFIDRQILGLLVTPIKLDLGISDTRIGLLQGLAFGIFYTLLGMPMGRIVDRGNRRNLVVVGIWLWSLMTASCAGARGFWTLFLARMGVGVGEATLSPSAFSLLSDYFPKERLGTALSIFSMGVFFGSGSALIVGGLVIGAVGSWRLTFLIVGLPGLLAGLMALTIKEPARKHLLGGKESKLSFGEVFEQVKVRWRSVLGICLAFAFQAMCNYAQQAWLPTYFVRAHGWQPRQAGLTLGAISLGAGLLGAYSGGVLCDRWQSLRKTDAPLRVAVLATTCAGFFFTLAIAITALKPQLALLVPAFFFLAMPIGSGYASLQLILPNQVRGQIGALQVFTLNLIGLILGPFLPGFFNDYLFKDPLMVGWSLALTVGLASLVSALLFRATWRPYREHYAHMHK